MHRNDTGFMEHLAYISENAVRLSGHVTDVLMTDSFAVISLLTSKEVDGRVYTCSHMVKIRKENTAFSEAIKSKQGDMLAIKGAIDPDQAIVPFLFLKTDAGAVDPLQCRSENDVRLRGAVKSACIEHNAAYITLLTSKQVDGSYILCEHRVKVLKKNRAYSEASLSRENDIITIKGVIHPDKSIVPFLFFAETARKDRRIPSTSDKAVIAQQRDSR